MRGIDTLCWIRSPDGGGWITSVQRDVLIEARRVFGKWEIAWRALTCEDDWHILKDDFDSRELGLAAAMTDFEQASHPVRKPRGN